MQLVLSFISGETAHFWRESWILTHKGHWNTATGPAQESPKNPTVGLRALPGMEGVHNI